MIGILGLGAMGLPIARLLARAGHEVVGFDPDGARAAAAQPHGIAVAPSPRALAEAASALVLVLVRTGEQAAAALAGDDGLGAAGLPRTAVLMSTVGVQAARALDERARGLGIDLLDAPVSGGTAGAEAGTLTVMLGGPPALRERARPVLDVLAGEVVVAGDRAGDGQGVKLVNQQAMCVTLVGLAEGLRLAAALGLDRDVVLRALAHGTGRSWAVENWPLVAGLWERYTPDGSLELLRKDLGHILTEARAAGLDLPLTTTTEETLPDAWPRA